MGVSVSQAPPANRYRSSWGRTARSKPVRSRPDFSIGGVGAGAAGAAAGSGRVAAHAARAAVNAAATAMMANRWNMEIPGERCEGIEYKKGPGLWGLGA